MIIKAFIIFYIGAYVPLTLEGNIMVDGVLASCYLSSNHHLAHFAMKPMQWFPKITEWILGVDTGFQVYHNIAEHVGKWILPNMQGWEY